MPDHDSLHHRLFDHPDMVSELLREFVPGPWLDDLDLASMQRLNAKFHAETGERREGDMIWRIPRRGGGNTYLVLLLEFQSTPDRWMALRVLVYAGLLWQHLVNEKSLPADGKLPPILPVVLYNGDGGWASPLSVHELVGLPTDSPLWQWQPTVRYQVVVEGAFTEDDLARRDALVALLFRLEGLRHPEQLGGLTQDLVAWFGRHPGYEALQAAFVTMLGAILAQLAPGVRMPEELSEFTTMLATKPEIWKRAWLEEGKEEGRLEGEQKGRLEGRLEGEAALLLRQLERRFGVLPGWAQDRIAAADTAALEEWGLRVLDAGSLEDVLA